jgi:hypothetical protein
MFGDQLLKPLDVSDWVWAAGGGGGLGGPYHQCLLAGTASLHINHVRMLPLGGCREIVGGVCRLGRRVSGYL